MRYTRDHKAETRKKILETAGRLFRERGYDGVGVDAIMSEAGLTAGGFYSHFKSKQALFAESLGNAYDSRNRSLQASLKSKADSDPLQNLIYSYLSRTHRDMTGEGCIFPTLTTDVMRGSNETRESYEKRLRKFIQTIESQLPEGATPKRERAIAVLVQLIGGVMLARAVNDNQLSVDILKSCRQAAMQACKE
jgi:TetR/AcrR family transcriptional regulator, transcriptional repressor for nem operon